MDTPFTPDIKFLEPTFRRAAVVYWALFWRAILIGGGAGFLVGFVGGFVGAMAGVPPTTTRPLILIAAAIVGVPVGIHVVRLVLRKSYSEFTIRLVPTEAGK